MDSCDTALGLPIHQPVPFPAAPGRRVDSALMREMLRGLRSVAPVLIGLVPFALLLGAQARAKGFGAIEVPLLTGLNFAGGSEFAAIRLWTSPPHLLLLVSVTLLVNCRHMLMGAVFAPHLRRHVWWKRFLALALMCDESWALGLADARQRAARGQPPVMSGAYYAGVVLGLYAVWVPLTALGGLIGPALGDVTRFGFDMAFPAVFFVLLRGMWQGTRAAVPWLVSGAVAALVCLTVPGAWYVPAGAASGVLAAWIGARP